MFRHPLAETYYGASWKAMMPKDGKGAWKDGCQKICFWGDMGISKVLQPVK